VRRADDLTAYNGIDLNGPIIIIIIIIIILILLSSTLLLTQHVNKKSWIIISWVPGT